MDEELLDKDVAKEVLMILLHSGNYIQDKMPADFLKNLTDLAADSNLEVHLDKNKSLKDQNLSNDALDTFALLYYLYVANDSERDEILSHWVINDNED
ncbi:MAG: hypothetical protein IKQ35_06200 [Bacilli bacterium]|nr:hypothetical protein [Bacilli bacterium]